MRTKRKSQIKNLKAYYRSIGIPELYTCPCGKQCYVDELSAKVMLIAKSSRHQKNLNAYYQCDKSQFWHLTSHGKTRNKEYINKSHSTSLAEALIY